MGGGYMISVMLLQFVIRTLLMCVVVLQSQASDQAYTVSVPIRHSLPDSRIVSQFGSSGDGNCSQIRPSSHRGSICDGISVLNDGILPALSNVSSDSGSLWAAQLLTMRQIENTRITLSFEVKNQSYNCMELAVFNCPEMGMMVSRLNIFQDNSFRPERLNPSLGDTIKSNYFLSNTSCDYLLKFYVNFMPEVNSSYFNIEFPGLTSVNYVFMGEVSFLTGAGNCEQWPPELVQKTSYYLQTSKSAGLMTSTEKIGDTTGTANTNELMSSASLGASSTSYTPSQPSIQIHAIIIVVTVLPTLIFIITLGVISIVVALLCLRNRKRKQKANNIQCLENSAYQEIKNGKRFNHIPCLENSAYLEIKRGHEFQCEENCAYQECHTEQQYIEIDNIQSPNSDHEECL